MMTDPKYDPETCVTAGQLRRFGFDLPAHIPEMGWVSHCAVFNGTDVVGGLAYPGMTEAAVSIAARRLMFRWTESEERAPWLPESYGEVRPSLAGACVPSEDDQLRSILDGGS